MIDPVTAAALIAAGAIGYAITHDGKVVPISPAMLQDSEVRVVKKIEIDTAVARDNIEFNESGAALYVENPSTPTTTVYIRFNYKEGEILELTGFRKIKGPFGKFFITNEAGSGILTLIVTKGFAFDFIESEVITAGWKKLIPFYTLRSDKDDHFTGAIITNAIEQENLTGLVANKIRITGMVILSDQQLHYRVVFFSTDAFADTDLDIDSLINEVEFDLPGFGRRIADTGKYSMVITGLSVDYIDEDASNELHVALQNLSGTTKTAGGDGEVVLRFIYEERD